MKKNESTGRGRTNGIYQVTKDECERCVRDALEVGYRSIDTAQSYFNEEEVGKAIEKSGIDRKEIFLTSKVWIEHFGYEECKKSVLESVEKLRTDYLDLMLLHQPFGDTYGAWRALEELYKEGKLHAIGISNHYTDRMVEFANFTNIKPMHIAKLNGRLCGAKRPHSVSEQPNFYQSLQSNPYNDSSHPSGGE